MSTFHSSPFEYGAIALINKPNQVVKKYATIIDNVIALNIFDKSLKKRHINPFMHNVVKWPNIP